MKQSKALQNTEPIDGEIVTTSDNALAISKALPLDQHPAVVYLAGLSTKNSRNTMRRGLEAIADLLGFRVEKVVTRNGKPVAKKDESGKPMFDDNGEPIYKTKMVGNPLAVAWHELRFQHTNAIKAQLTGMYGAATVNNFLSALRGVLKTANLLELMTYEDYNRAKSVDGVTGSTVPAGRDIDGQEINMIFEACDIETTEPKAIRDKAILVLLRNGMRVSEIANLTMDRVKRNNPSMWEIVFKGKRDKERQVWLKHKHLRIFKAWCDLRGYEDGALFNPITRYGVIEDRHLSRQAIFKLCKTLADKAEISDFSPHDFRRSFIGDQLDIGTDIVTIRDMVGHSSVQTTARYDRRPKQRMIDAFELIQK